MGQTTTAQGIDGKPKSRWFRMRWEFFHRSDHVRLNLCLVWLMVSCSLPVLAETNNDFFQYVQERSNQFYRNVPHEVLALYYGWYGQTNRNAWGDYDIAHHQIKKTAHYPVNGPYSSHDVAIIDWQIDQAKAHGISGFVVSWWGKGDYESWHDQTLALLLERAEKKQFKISVYWEHERNTEAQLIQFAVDDLTYVLQTYGSKKAFLKVDGKPVLFSYNSIQWQTPLASLVEILKKVRAQAGDFLLIGQDYQANAAYLFDGLHTDYGKMPLDLLANPTPENMGQFRDAAAKYFEKGSKLARSRGRIHCPMIIPGFDNSKSSPANVKADRCDGQIYRILWEEAIRTRPDWILISSWNEWLESTEIEPSLELGDQYLQITATYAKPFLNSAPVDVPAPAGLAEFNPGTGNVSADILAGKKIAILLTDGSYDSEFWADCLGAAVQRLTWKDLIDPNRFTASNFPVVIYIGGEHYPSSLKVTDDVTASLVRYLHQGGFFILLPVAPWPFYYDDSRKGVTHAITDQLGIGVDGWDSKYFGSGLTFVINTNALHGLAPSVPFPATGDLRWTGVSARRLPAGAAYGSIARLKDNQGHAFGEGIVLIQHRAGPLSPGQILYAWMRMPELLGEDQFYPSLFQFISTKVKSSSGRK